MCLVEDAVVVPTAPEAQSPQGTPDKSKETSNMSHSTEKKGAGRTAPMISEKTSLDAALEKDAIGVPSSPKTPLVGEPPSASPVQQQVSDKQKSKSGKGKPKAGSKVVSSPECADGAAEVGKSGKRKVRVGVGEGGMTGCGGW
jgi:hypothetical protein